MDDSPSVPHWVRRFLLTTVYCLVFFKFTYTYVGSCSSSSSLENDPGVSPADKIPDVSGNNIKKGAVVGTTATGSTTDNGGPLSDSSVKLLLPEMYPPALSSSWKPDAQLAHSSSTSKGVILTTFFKPQNVRWGWAKPKTSFEYMRDFYKSVAFLRLPTVIFHDWIADEEEFLAQAERELAPIADKRSTARRTPTSSSDGPGEKIVTNGHHDPGPPPIISLVRVDSATMALMSANDFRFYAYKEWLNRVDPGARPPDGETESGASTRPHPRDSRSSPAKHSWKFFEYVLFADIKDAFFVADPFAFMQQRHLEFSENLFVQTDCDCSVEEDHWQKYVLRTCIWGGREEKRGRGAAGFRERPVFSAGMWGGRRREVDGMLECMAEELWKTRLLRRGNCNMAVFHECMHAYGSANKEEGAMRFPNLKFTKKFGEGGPKKKGEPLFNRYRRHAESAIALHKTVDCLVIDNNIIRAEPAGDGCQPQSDGSDEYTTTLSPEEVARAEEKRLQNTIPPSYWFNVTKQAAFVDEFINLANEPKFSEVTQKAYTEFFSVLDRADRKRGVWTSEAHALVTAIVRSGVNVVLESGMANGVSTELMAYGLRAVMEQTDEQSQGQAQQGRGDQDVAQRFSRDIRHVDIHSFELGEWYGRQMYEKTTTRLRDHGWVVDPKDPPNTNKKIAVHPSLGDSLHLIPRVLDALQKDDQGKKASRVGILIDGPKKFPAYQFAKQLLESYESVQFVGIHDTAPFWGYKYFRWQRDPRMIFRLPGADPNGLFPPPSAPSDGADGGGDRRHGGHQGRGVGNWVEFPSEQAQTRDVWALPVGQGPGVVVVPREEEGKIVPGRGTESRPPFVLETFSTEWRKRVGDLMDQDEMKAADRPEGAGLTIYSRD